MEEKEIQDVEYIDYEKLKNEALNYLKKIGGEKWNYYDEHDPGITILENLCFAIMDLDYRINFPIEDLLAKNPKKHGEIVPFFMPEEILPSAPVTLNDYYKLILDIDGVRNCKIIPQVLDNRFTGFYDILLHIEPFTEKNQKQTINKVRERLQENRNLCENFNKIETFEPLEVFVDISLEPNLDMFQEAEEYDIFAGEILCKIQEYFIPKIKFKKLSDALNIKKNLDEVYNGPLLEHGFILDEDLEKNTLQNNFYIIDLIDLINDQKKIWKILSFSIFNAKTNERYKNSISTEENQIVWLSFAKSSIKLYHNNSLIKTNFENCIMFAKRKYNLLNVNDNANIEEIGIYEGRYRNLLDYSSIQKDFPLIYGIGEEGIADSEPEEKKEQVHNLKMYLLIFDQLIYLYLHKLENIKNLLAIRFDNNLLVKNKYPKDVPNVESLLKIPQKTLNGTHISFSYLQNKYLDINTSHTKEDIYKSCNSYINFISNYIDKNLREFMIDHLLARFNEKIDTNYCEQRNIKDIKQQLLSNYNILSSNRSQAMNTLQFYKDGNLATFTKKMSIVFGINITNSLLLHMLVKNKFYIWRGFAKQNIKVLLKEEQQNNSGFVFKSKFKDILKLVLLYGGDKKNYCIIKKESLNNIIGSKKKRQALYEIRLYVNETKTKFINLESTKSDLVDYTLAKKIIDKSVDEINKFNIESEGFHLIEHILLCDNCNDSELYKDCFFKATMIFPNWPYRFQKENFRKNIERWIYDNSPAHLYIKVLWLDMKQIEIFEYAFKDLLEAKNEKIIDKEKIKTASLRLMKILNNFSKDENIQ